RCRCPPRRSTSRPHIRRFLFVFRLVRLAQLNRAALLYVIAGIHRELDDDIAADDGLAAEPRVRPEIPRGVEPIELLILRLAEVLLAFLDVEVTRRAGAAAAAGVLERNPEIHRDVEERFGQSMVLVRELPPLELDARRLAVLAESDLRHHTAFTLRPASASRAMPFILASARCCVA